MHSGKLSKSLWIEVVITAATLLGFIKCNTARKSAQVSSVDLSLGKGSSGGVAHKTWTQYGGGADRVPLGQCH